MSTAAAKGTVQIDGQWTNLEVVISRASSDDPPNRQDPGQEFDLADCLFNLVQDKTADVAIINGYPGYSCTIYVTVHNRSGQAVQLQETVFGASPGLEVLEVNNPRPALILPGKKSDRAFQIRILERAAEQAELDFQVLFSYSPADPGP